MVKYPKQGLNTFGIYCWHSYITNPKIVEIQITDNIQNNNINFKILGVFELEMRPGKQLFPLNYNNIINDKNIKNNIKAIKLIIRETYGGKRTYINQIMFYEQTAEQVKDLICGNELSKIYKRQKKLIKNNTNKNLNSNFNKKFRRNNDNDNANKVNNMTQITCQKDFRADISNEEYINQCNTQIINDKRNKKNKKNRAKSIKYIKNIKKNKYFKNESEDDNGEDEEEENEEQFGEDVDSDGDDDEMNSLYDDEEKIIDLEEDNNEREKEKTFFKEEENNEEVSSGEENDENKNEGNITNYNNKNNNQKKYHKINNNKKKINKKKRQSLDITSHNKPLITQIPNIKKNTKNKHYKRQQLEIKSNDNLTPNKYLKRVKSFSSKNNTVNSNLSLNLSKNLGIILNNKEIQQNYSHYENISNINNINNIDISNISNNGLSTKIPCSIAYNYNMSQLPNEENQINDEQNNLDKYQINDEKLSDNYNLMNSGNEFYHNSLNQSKMLVRNNFNNNFEYEEQQRIFNESNNKSYMNKTFGDIMYHNRNLFIQSENMRINPSFISNRQSNNTSLYNERKKENNENYMNNNISQMPRDNNILSILNTNNTNNNSHNSQRLSFITNNDNYKNSNDIKNNKTQIKQKLDYLEGNVIEIKNEINSISESLSYLTSKEFINNNLKDYIVQICEEIYSENYNDNDNKEKNNSIITNSNYENYGNNIKNTEEILENEINKKIDEKLGNLKNSIFDKFLKPTINKIGDSMKQNIEEIKSKVDTISNNKNIFEKSISNIQNDDEDEEIYKSSSKLRNEKFDEINRIGEKLYNKLLEKEKKLKMLKEEKTKFLNQESQKDNIDIEVNY